MKLQDKIVKLRKINGMSQEDLAERLHVSRQSISRWEGGLAQPDATNILQLSKLFSVTTDFLLNDDYESDFDLPLVQSVNNESNIKKSKIIALSITALGLLGNLIIYILSRVVEVMVPFITYEGQKKIYRWSSDFTGRSYKYFIQEYNLAFLVILFWILLVLGLITLFIPREKLLKYRPSNYHKSH